MDEIAALVQDARHGRLEAEVIEKPNRRSAITGWQHRVYGPTQGRCSRSQDLSPSGRCFPSDDKEGAGGNRLAFRTVRGQAQRRLNHRDDIGPNPEVLIVSALCGQRCERGMQT